MPGHRLSDAAAGDRRRQAAGRRCERAGRCTVQRDDGPGRLGGVGLPRPGAVRVIRLVRVAPGAPVRIEGEHPRFTMIGGDVETVRGEWGIRGEVAAFVDDNFQSRGARGRRDVVRRGRRRRSPGRQLSHQRHRPLSPRTYRPSAPGSSTSPAGPICRLCCPRTGGLPGSATGVGIRRGEHVGGLGLRARHRVRGAPRQPLARGSIGWFVGDGRDLVGRFADSDFAYVRLKYYF